MKKSKKTSLAVAAILIAIALLTGTFAFTVITAVNEFRHSTASVLLHDDFDAKGTAAGVHNKDIYVENTGKSPIFVRVQLQEKLVVGSDDKTKANDWKTHIPSTHNDCTATDGVDLRDGTKKAIAFHSVFDWVIGQSGTTYFIPKQGVAPGKTYAQSKDGVAVKSTDPGAIPTTSAPMGGASGPTVVLLKDYKLMPDTWQKAFVGWIYDDTDGFAYWSKPLEPNTATSFLLDQVIIKSAFANEDYYYAINVLMEAVTADEESLWNGALGATPPPGTETLGFASSGMEPYLPGIFGSNKANKTALEAALAAAKPYIDAGTASPLLQSAVSLGNDTMDDPDATQAIVDFATEAILGALPYGPVVNKAALEAALALAKPYIDNGTAPQALKDAVGMGKIVLDSPSVTQTDVDTAAAAILAAIPTGPGTIPTKPNPGPNGFTPIPDDVSYANDFRIQFMQVPGLILDRNGAILLKDILDVDTVGAASGYTIEVVGDADKAKFGGYISLGYDSRKPTDAAIILSYLPSHAEFGAALPELPVFPVTVKITDTASGDSATVTISLVYNGAYL